MSQTSIERRGWRPLLHGELASSARTVAFEIAEEIGILPFSSTIGLKGEASNALLLAYCDHSLAEIRLEAALRICREEPMTVSLFGGIAGLGWVVQHLANENDAELVIKQYDDAIIRYLDVPTWTDRLDLMSGLVGVGVYISSRSDERAQHIASRVLTHLEASKCTTEHGITWLTATRFLPAERGRLFPHGVIDLGVAHGVPGVIGVLAQLLNAGLQPERCGRLLVPAVQWLLASVPEAAHRRGRFGTNWPAANPEPPRLGWCYGDAGVAAVLLAAGKALGMKEICDTAVHLLRRLAASEPEALDACFCHGAAGLAHIYNVAYQVTSCEELGVCATNWFMKLLNMRVPRTGIAGYRSLAGAQGTTHWRNDTTLLTGATGVALVLLAAIGCDEPAWHRLFLL